MSRYKNIKQQTDIIYNEKIVFGFRTLVANFQWVCYGTNYIFSPKSDYVVIEADEFDRSFHWLRPYMSVITSFAITSAEL